MSAKLQNSPAVWVDPEDAPELSDEFFEGGTWRVGDRVLSRSVAQAEVGARRDRIAKGASKMSASVQIDADVLAAFKATGDGWQARVNEVLKEWLRSH